MGWLIVLLYLIIVIIFFKYWIKMTPRGVPFYYGANSIWSSIVKPILFISSPIIIASFLESFIPISEDFQLQKNIVNGTSHMWGIVILIDTYTRIAYGIESFLKSQDDLLKQKGNPHYLLQSSDVVSEEANQNCLLRMSDKTPGSSSDQSELLRADETSSQVPLEIGCQHYDESSPQIL